MFLVDTNLIGPPHRVLAQLLRHERLAPQLARSASPADLFPLFLRARTVYRCRIGGSSGLVPALRAAARMFDAGSCPVNSAAFGRDVHSNSGREADTHMRNTRVFGGEKRAAAAVLSVGTEGVDKTPPPSNTTRGRAWTEATTLTEALGGGRRCRRHRRRRSPIQSPRRARAGSASWLRQPARHHRLPKLAGVSGGGGGGGGVSPRAARA